MAKARLNNPLVQVGMRVPQSLVKKIDAETRKRQCSRTDFLIAIIREYFKNKKTASVQVLTDKNTSS